MEPSIHKGRRPVLRILFHDASASCGAHAAPDADEIAALLDGLGPGDLVQMDSFGDWLLVVGECAPSEFRAKLREELSAAHPPSPHGSRLFGHLWREAMYRSHGPNAHRLEVVLATDGLVTDALRYSVRAVAQSLRSAGCESIRVLGREPVELPSCVAQLRGPGAARAGEPFSLEARGVARTDDVVVELSDANGVVETRRITAKGPFRLAFTRIEEKAGPSAFTARVVGTNEIPPPVARVSVTAPGSALVLGTAPRDIPGAGAAWRDIRDVRHDDASALLASNDVVILDDLSSANLDEFRDTLRDFATRGGGIVLLGGAHSFGTGGWAGTWVEDLSPLTARPRDEKGALLYLALDGSGSMAEAWSGAAGAATRDAVVRAAAKLLVRSASDDTTVALRRFSYDVLPQGASVESHLVRGPGRDRLAAEIESLSEPGGATALLPPLREALSLAASRGEERKAALILTDGRTPEKSAELHEALAALDAASVRVTFVLPGDGALDDEARALKDALIGTKAEVRGATSPERLAEVFRDVEEKARVDEPVVTNRRLVLDRGAAGLVDVAPGSAAQVDRVWLADGARQLAVTDRGEPVAALRRVGLGTVAALATRPGDTEWLAAGDATARLVASLVRAAARPASGRVRVERDGDARVLVRYDAPPGGGMPSFVEFDEEHSHHRTRAPLVPADGGLLAAELEIDEPALAPKWIDLVAADGRVLATSGLDERAPAEYRDPPRVDLEALAALVGRPPDGAPFPLAPWLAGAAVVLAVGSVAAARVKSRTVRAR